MVEGRLFFSLPLPRAGVRFLLEACSSSGNPSRWESGTPSTRETISLLGNIQRGMRKRRCWVLKYVVDTHCRCLKTQIAVPQQTQCEPCCRTATRSPTPGAISLFPAPFPQPRPDLWTTPRVLTPRTPASHPHGDAASKEAPQPCSSEHPAVDSSLGSGSITPRKNHAGHFGAERAPSQQARRSAAPVSGASFQKNAANRESAILGRPMEVCTNADGQALRNYPTSCSTSVSSILRNHFSYCLFGCKQVNDPEYW